MRITVKQLKQLIREQVAEMSHMGGVMEGSRGQAVYTPDDLKKLDYKQLRNIGRDAVGSVGSEPHEAFIEFPSGRQEEIASVMVDEYGDLQVDFVRLIDPIRIPVASAKRRR